MPKSTLFMVIILLIAGAGIAAEPQTDKPSGT
jgi:hypothetical protein